MSVISRIGLFCLFAFSCEAFAPMNTNSMRSSTLLAAESPIEITKSRREMMTVFGGLLLSPIAANALDFDAFANGEIEADVKNCDPKRDPKCIPKLSADEALCKYGQSGKARGEACKRVKAGGGELPSAKPQGKSLGGAYAM